VTIASRATSSRISLLAEPRTGLALRVVLDNDDRS
jgi:hypothetical protein